MKRFLFAPALALALAGCATGPSAPEKPFVATGGINSTVGSASFDDDMVVGPKVNLKKVGESDWRGTLRDQTVDVTVHGDHVTGVGFTLQITHEKNSLVVTGQLNGRIFRFERDPNRLMIRTDTRSDNLPRTSENEFSSVKFDGDAIKADPPEPQFAFALMGTFL
jgi:hypothetical protein